MKYVHEILFVDETSEKQLVERYREYIVDQVTEIAKDNFDFDIKLYIKIEELGERKNYVNSEVEAGFTIKYDDDSWELSIGLDSLKRFQYDGGLDLDIVIWHEMAHIYDLYKITHNKFYKIDPIHTRHKRETDYILYLGSCFWTEIFAYYNVFAKFYNLHQYPTYYQIVKGYEKLCKDYEKIKSRLITKDKKVREDCEEFIETIRSFTYAVAKYLAGEMKGKRRYHKVLQTKENKKYMDDVDKIVYRLCRSCSKMFAKNCYGKGLARRLYDIGCCILKEIYTRFQIAPKKYRGKIALAYYV